MGRAAVFGAILGLPASPWLLVAMNLSIGALFGGGNIFGPAVQADVIDGEARRSGERKDGTFFATWSLVERSAQGVAIALSGLLLALSGFEPNVVQGERVRLGIRMLFAGLPCAFYVLAALLLARLPTEAGARLPSGGGPRASLASS